MGTVQHGTAIGMNVVIGASGKTGGAVAAALLEAGKPTRVLVTQASKGDPWKARGAQLAVGNLDDEESLVEAFKGATAVSTLNPTALGDDDQCGAAERRAKNTVAALRRSGSVKKVVVLSGISAHLDDKPTFGLIHTIAVCEREFSQLDIPVAFVRPAWFLDNLDETPDLVKQGMLPTMLNPDVALDIVATADVGAIMAQTLLSGWTSKRVIEVKAPNATSYNDAAALMSDILGKPVQASFVPEEQWPAVFRASLQSYQGVVQLCGRVYDNGQGVQQAGNGRLGGWVG